MERTKKQEKLIITNFVIFLLLIIISIIVFFSYLFPKIREIEFIKESAYNIYKDILRIQVEGLNFEEFQSSVEQVPIESFSGEEPEYLREIINSIDETFYSENLTNDSGENYTNFLKSQADSLENFLEEDKKDLIISQLLPVYSELIADLGDGTLSDFKFINYVESIIDTFSLTANNKIGIGDIELVEDYTVGILDSSLETNIYYIPLSLDLSGRRSDILDFLYFAGNVGKVKIGNDDINVDNEISADFRTSFRNKILKGQKAGDNIFNNQIFDIKLVNFDNYIDPNINISERYMNSSLVTYIKSTNFDPKTSSYKISVDLRFYIKGLPVYKIDSYIKGFVQRFNSIKGEINAYIENTKISSIERQKLLELNNILGQLDQGIVPEIIRDMNSNDTVNNAYILVNEYYPILNEYQNILNQINNSIGNTAK